MRLKPDCIVYFQGWYLDFRLAEILAGSLYCRGNVFTHDNLGAPPSPKPAGGLGLW